MTKKEIIKKINAIITKVGSFGVGEVEADCSPCVASTGSIVSLAEHFNIGSAEVEVYQTKGHSSDSIESFTEKYEDMPKSTLEAILELAEKFKEQEEE